MTRITVDNIKIPAGVSECDSHALRAAEKKLKDAGVPYTKDTLHIHKRSVDARKKSNITFVYSVCADSEIAYDKVRVQGIRALEISDIELPEGCEEMKARPVVIGFGPAGIFAALILAKCGYRPLVLERGDCVDKRVEKVDLFYQSRKLDTNTNIQFGAGGAGTFSDGKLVTRIGDSRTEYVLRVLHELGAPNEILWSAKPHIGTDILRKVVNNAADKICEYGGEIRYNTLVTKIGDGWVEAAGEKIQCSCAVLAPGHSARDTYKQLMDDGFCVEAKPFSVGVRIEHLQSELDRAMYGDEALANILGHAQYQLSHRRGERGVYTFCMCPGGQVVAAASEEGGVVTNGMSESLRASGIANAAVAVSVLPKDFGGDPTGAIEFQRKLERSAFMAGKGDYSAPCQSVKNLFEGKAGGHEKGKFTPTYMNGAVCGADFNKLFPAYISQMLKEGLSVFGKKIKGYDAPYIPLTGIETRTSAPLRLLRDNNTLCAIGHSCIYPCGEGAGYAGGITSAAVDGIRVAQAILARYRR